MLRSNVPLRIVCSALLATALVACGGGGSGGSDVAAPDATPSSEAKIASTVVVVPTTAVKDFTFQAEKNAITGTGNTSLAVGSVVKIGDHIVKITGRAATSVGTTYTWEAPTLDEAFDEINYVVPVMEVRVPVVQSTRQHPNAGGFDCKPSVAASTTGAGSAKVSCKAPLVGKSVMSASATVTLKYEGIKIIKTGKGSPATQEWKLTGTFEPEVGLRWGKGDKLAVTPTDQVLKTIPECAAGGLLSVLGRPLSTPPSWRYPLGSVPLATSGLLTLSMPACILVDAGDSALGLDILGKGKFSVSVVKLKDSDSPTFSGDSDASLAKAIADSVVGVNAAVVLKARLELTPMLHFGFVPVSGLYLNPGIDINVTAKATPLKQGICATIDFKSDIDWWATGVSRKGLRALKFGLASDKLLLGESCDPTQSPGTQPGGNPPAPANCGTTADFEAYVGTLPAFASAEMRGVVEAARRDAASLLPNLSASSSQLNQWIVGLDGQTAEYRTAQAGAETVYQQLATNPALTALCQRAVQAPSNTDLIDSIAIAWGATRIGIATNTWAVNQLQCKLSGNNNGARPLERFCPY